MSLGLFSYEGIFEAKTPTIDIDGNATPAINHSGLANLGIDDHTQYALAGGGRNTSESNIHILTLTNPHSVTIDQVTPTTTKGDIIVEDGANAVRLAVGTDGQFLESRASAAEGIQWVNRPPLIYEAVVDAAGAGDYTTVGAALTAGATSIYVRNGSYAEGVQNLTVSADTSIIGESMAGVVITFTAGGSGFLVDGGGTPETAGTISITKDTKAVTGAGTTFTNLSVGEFILLGTRYYEIDTITDATNLDVVKTYRGPTLSGVSWRGQAMIQDVVFKNLTIQKGSTSGCISFEQALNCKAENIDARGRINVDSSENVQVEGIYMGAENSGSAIVIDTTSYHIHVRNCDLSHQEFRPLWIRGTYCSVDDCHVSTMGGFAGTSGCHIDGDYNRISNLTVDHIQGSGIDIDGDYNVISNCIIDETEDEGIDFASGAEQNIVLGCIVTNAGANGIDVGTSKDNNVVVGCIVRGGASNGLVIGGGSTDTIVSSCHLKGNSGVNFSDAGTSTTSGLNETV